MKNLNEQKEYRLLEDLNDKEIASDPALNDMFVTRYMTGWDFNAHKVSTIIFGGNHEKPKSTHQ